MQSEFFTYVMAPVAISTKNRLGMSDPERQPFETVTRILDRAIEIARPTLESNRVEVRDWSNRSGFDRSSWGPYYTWDFWFAKRHNPNVIVSEVGVWLRYEQPLGSTEIVNLDSKWAGEVYHVGSRPFFRDEHSERLPVTSLSGEQLLDYVVLRLHNAECAIPDRYRLTDE